MTEHGINPGEDKRVHLVGNHLTTEMNGVVSTDSDREGGLSLTNRRRRAALEHDGTVLPPEAAHNLHKVGEVLGGIGHCRLHEHLELVRDHIPHSLLEHVQQKDRELESVSELTGEGYSVRAVDYLD